VLNIVLWSGSTNLDAIPPSPGHYHEIAQADTCQFSFVISLSAAAETIAEVNGIIETEPPEDRPTRAVSESAIKMIRNADECSLMYLAASEIESFEGDLLVHWAIREKRVTLIASGPDGRVKLYKRGKSNLSELIPNPTAIDLVSALTSLMQ
jgi:hypothetical protein